MANLGRFYREGFQILKNTLIKQDKNNLQDGAVSDLLLERTTEGHNLFRHRSEVFSTFFYLRQFFHLKNTLIKQDKNKLLDGAVSDLSKTQFVEENHPQVQNFRRFLAKKTKIFLTYS